MEENNKLASVMDQLDEVETWEAGWNGYTALPASPRAIHTAKKWITHLYGEIQAQSLPWFEPNITPGIDGEITCDWRKKDKTLTVYIGDESVEYLKAWGSNIFQEMDDGDIHTIEECMELYTWFVRLF